MAENSTQRSALKEFLAVGYLWEERAKAMINSYDQRGSEVFISLILLIPIAKFLSNITAPPFVLADKSTTELPRYWIEHPDLFCAPAKEKNPERRILAVLKWFLASLKGQQYAGREPDQGVKKPLNAFLGEVFTGSCGGKEDETHLVSEQVSHHPPVTACYLWNNKFGIRAEGYTRQEVTFYGSVNIRQFGYAILHVDEYDEDYLIPLPNVKVKGILTGGTYPELTESCVIVSSAGFVAEVDFSGKGMWGVGGKRNYVEARIYRSKDEKSEEPSFTAEGTWSESLTFKDDGGKVIDTYDVASASPTAFETLPFDRQDSWESRKAWSGVISSINQGDMKGVANHKQKLENAQRQLRKKPETAEENWAPLFFRTAESDQVAEKLLESAGKTLNPEQTCGIWKIDTERMKSLKRPWRGDLTPHG